MHQAAIAVIHGHEFLGAEEITGDDEGAKAILRDDSAGVADEVGIVGFESEGADGEASVGNRRTANLSSGRGVSLRNS